VVKLKKTLQTNIAADGLYDTKPCESNTVYSIVSYGSFIAILVWSVFFSFT